jgi:hypothetical protein
VLLASDVSEGVAVDLCEAGAGPSPLMPSSSAASLTVVVTFDGAMVNERVAAGYDCRYADVLAG